MANRYAVFPLLISLLLAAACLSGAPHRLDGSQQDAIDQSPPPPADSQDAVVTTGLDADQVGADSPLADLLAADLVDAGGGLDQSPDLSADLVVETIVPDATPSDAVLDGESADATEDGAVDLADQSTTVPSVACVDTGALNAGQKAIGESCSSDAECESGQCYDDDLFGSFRFCTANCDVACPYACSGADAPFSVPSGLSKVNNLKCFRLPVAEASTRKFKAFCMLVFLSQDECETRNCDYAPQTTCQDSVLPASFGPYRICRP